MAAEIWSFCLISWQDGDLEDVDTGDVGKNEELLYSATAASHTSPTYEYLDAMAKAFNEVWHIGCTYLFFPAIAFI